MRRCFLGDGVDKDMDMVNHPPHYADSKIEVIEAIEAWDLDYHESNVVKYVARAEKKHKTLAGRIEDLKKAVWYLNRKIKLLEESND